MRIQSLRIVTAMIVFFKQLRSPLLVTRLCYKAMWYSNTMHVANRWFASSKICSECHIKKTALSLNDQQFQCDTWSYL